MVKDYLSNRTQYVAFNSCTSEPGNIISGVPQGSILGPLLFYIVRKRYHVYFKCT